MKISNETKVGSLTVIAIVLLILGFNFLKGKSLFKSGTYIYAKLTDAKGLLPSHPVTANGYQVGTIQSIEPADDHHLNNLIVEIKMTGDYSIPKNSVAQILSNPLGTPSIDIALGNDPRPMVNKDTIQVKPSTGLLGNLTSKVEPIADRITVALGSLDTVLKNMNSALDPNTKGNLQGTMANLNRVTASLVVSAASLQTLLNEQSGALAKTFENANAFSKNLADNNPKITNVLTNLETTTGKLANADVESIVKNLQTSVNELQTFTSKLNSTDGTLGALMNDRQLYNRLNSVAYSANVLIDDLRAHPKRYVGISIFGKKDKGDFLMQPLPQLDSIVDAKPKP